MYRQVDNDPKPAENFKLGNTIALAANNRWVIMANLIPWTEFEGEYAKNFPTEMGAPAKPFRMALGALIIKEKLGTSDRETVEQIRENPYLQYLIGLEEYQDEAPFDASMLVHFRQRIGRALINQIKGKIVAENRTQEREEQGEKKSTKDSENVIKEKRNRGKLIVEASCAPADVKDPTDLDLLATARVESEKIIDILDRENRPKGKRKSRTHRQIARKEYLKVAKQNRISWDNYNESNDLIDRVESFKGANACYPKSVHADKIYRTRANRAWCKERGIRLSGSPLGRPRKGIDTESKKQAKSDERIRNQIEGKFGVAKRRFSLDRVMTKLYDTSETAIAIIFLVMNLSHLLRQIIEHFFVSLIFDCFQLSIYPIYRLEILLVSPLSLTKNYHWRSSLLPSRSKSIERGTITK